MYNKLFTKILDSTIWLESDATRLVWITFLAVMDEDGFAALSSLGNVAARARVSLEAAEEAVRTLESPDHQNPHQEFEGRRIERVPYGWMVLNASKYRDIIKRETAREQTRIRVARHREKLSSNADVTEGNEKVTPSYTDTEAGKAMTDRACAVRVLQFLNEKAGKKFQPVPANLKPIMARLKEFDEKMLRAIVLHRCQLWSKDEKMAEYLRPATLFNATKCAQYAGELQT